MPMYGLGVAISMIRPHINDTPFSFFLSAAVVATPSVLIPPPTYQLCLCACPAYGGGGETL